MTSTTGRVRVRYKPATVGLTDVGFPSRQNRPSPFDQQLATSSLNIGDNIGNIVRRTTSPPFPAF